MSARQLSIFISAVFHPLLMATYGCVLIFFLIRNTIFDYLTPFDIKWRISAIVFLFSFLFPALNIFLLYKLKRIPSITMSDPRERTFPFMMTAVFYFGLFYLLTDLNIWPTVKLFVLGGGIAISLVTLINLRYKISAHMTGVGGLLGTLISLSYLIKFDMTLFYILVILVAGLLGTSRMIMNEHKPSQIYTGFALGIFVQVTLFFVYGQMNFN